MTDAVLLVEDVGPVRRLTLHRRLCDAALGRSGEIRFQRYSRHLHALGGRARIGASLLRRDERRIETQRILITA